MSGTSGAGWWAFGCALVVCLVLAGVLIWVLLKPAPAPVMAPAAQRPAACAAPARSEAKNLSKIEIERLVEQMDMEEIIKIKGIKALDDMISSVSAKMQSVAVHAKDAFTTKLHEWVKKIAICSNRSNVEAFDAW